MPLLKQFYFLHLFSDLGEKLFLTPFLEDGDAEGARAAAALSEDLPDVGNLLSGSSYAGYITVDEENDGHTFFWFVEATEENPADAPVVVWLQGGPGASSMFGLLEIHGPISTVAGEGTDSDEVRAEEREFAWSRKANMLYIDNPLGAGKSSKQDEGCLMFFFFCCGTCCFCCCSCRRRCCCCKCCYVYCS